MKGILIGIYLPNQSIGKVKFWWMLTCLNKLADEVTLH